MVLLEPNPYDIPNLNRLWAHHSDCEVVKAVWCEETHCPGNHILYQTAMPNGKVSLAEDEFDARRLNPAVEPTTIEIPCWSINQVDTDVPIRAVSFDAAVSSAVTSAALVKAQGIDHWLITTQDVLPTRVQQVGAELMEVGYRAAGRPWGAAGSGIALTRTGDFHKRVEAWKAQTRTQVGEGIVRVRDRLPLGERWQAFVRRGESVLNSGFSFDSNIDPSFGLPLSPIDPQTVELTINAALTASTEFEINVQEVDPNEIARECHTKLGFFPISFSHPTVEPLSTPQHRLSPIIPGFPYSFDSELDYTNHYTACNLAITHRKAGWDCFRHVEIGASGAVPLMPDAEDIPSYSMVHYPKETLSRIHQRVMRGGTPGPATRAALRAHFLRHQTTRAMAEYIIRNSQASSASRVLFIDEQLPLQADYLSVLTLVGLKEIFGSKCEVMHPVDYIYEDSQIDTANLYGRGFGYTKLLSAVLRSPSEPQEATTTSTSVPDPRLHDLVIIGSLYRNQQAFSQALINFPNDRIVALYGEDTPPTSALTRRMRDSKATIFMRPNHYRS